jgi:hypothetical protein
MSSPPAGRTAATGDAPADRHTPLLNDHRRTEPSGALVRAAFAFIGLSDVKTGVVLGSVTAILSFALVDEVQVTQRRLHDTTLASSAAV